MSNFLPQPTYEQKFNMLREILIRFAMYSHDCNREEAALEVDNFMDDVDEASPKHLF